jgi:hypothetical protein
MWHDHGLLVGVIDEVNNLAALVMWLRFNITRVDEWPYEDVSLLFLFLILNFPGTLYVLVPVMNPLASIGT